MNLRQRLDQGLVFCLSSTKVWTSCSIIRILKFMKPTQLFLSLMMFYFSILHTLAARADCEWPVRQSSSWSSQQFFERYRLPGAQRELAIIDQFLSGNFPNQLKQFIPLHLEGSTPNGILEVDLTVSPDYFALGTDGDSVRTPMTNYAAQFIASFLGMALPTAFLVDRIYDQATTKLNPEPTDWYKRDPEMRLGPNYWLFNQNIEKQRQGRPPLLAGHKKDVIVTNLLDSAPQRVAIYGWQREGNRPIQPIGTPHEFVYEDYSHGIRLIGPMVLVRLAGSARRQLSIQEAYKDPTIGKFLNGGSAALNDVRAARRCSNEILEKTGLSPENCPPQPQRCLY